MMKGFFRTNMRLKVMALGFALALWFFVAGQSRTEVGLLVPVGFKGVPRGLVMASAPPDELEVRVAGPKLFITNISASQLSAEIDLSGAREGVNEYTVQPRDVTTPMGVEAVRVRPNTLEVRLERLVEAELPVKAKITGRVAGGYAVSEVSVSPKSVKATATRTAMRDVVSIATKPVDVSGLSASTVVSAELDRGGAEFRSLGADKVEVKVIIRKEKRR